MMTKQLAISQMLISLIIWQCLLISLANPLSITPSQGGVKSSAGTNLNGRNIGQSSQNAQLQQQPVGTNNVQHHQTPPTVTTLPPLMTTIVQNNNNNNNIDSSSSSPTSENFHHTEYQAQSSPQVDNGAKFRSNLEDHDDSVPLATVNNHSKNNAQIRPPQYVDVSALVGRDRNLTSGGSFPGSGPNSSQTQAANSLLSPKSRSGLPECATQQVCNAIFVRMNYTQRLCECSSNYNWKCSNNLDPQDGHTIELTRKYDKRIYTQIKTCEPLREVRACKSPTDWTLLALQSERSGKAHYVVVCKCPTWAQLEGPYTHNHPPYANIPGIRVYGMLCAHQTARSSSAQTYSAYNPALSIYPEFPWPEALNVLNTTNLLNTLDSTPSSSSSSSSH